MTGAATIAVPGRCLPRIAVAALALVLIAGAAVSAWVVSLGPVPLDQARQVSTTVVDRNGKLLRAYAMADGRWRLPVHAASGVDPTYVKLLLAYEDQRFRTHAGVDPQALGRAASARSRPSCARSCGRSIWNGNSARTKSSIFI